MPAVRLSADVVERARKLIGPKPEDRDTCVSHIMQALDQVERERRDLPYMMRLKSAAGKQAARNLQSALGKLHKALNDDELPSDLRVLWTPPPLGQAEQLEQFAAIINRVERKSRTISPRDFMPLTKSEADAWLAAWIDRVVSMRKRKPLPLRIESEVRKTAAREAHDLLRFFSQEKISAERNSKYCKLAALL